MTNGFAFTTILIIPIILEIKIKQRKGKKENNERDQKKELLMSVRTCKLCMGNGWVRTFDLFPRVIECRICGGTGKIKVEEAMIKSHKKLELYPL